MAVQAALDFREAVGASPELQKQVLQALSKGDTAGLVAAGKGQGYDFTESEAKEAISQIASSGKLNDFELEMASGGVGPGDMFRIK